MSDNDTRNEHTAPEMASSGNPMRILGAILIVAAILMYFLHDRRVGKTLPDTMQVLTQISKNPTLPIVCIKAQNTEDAKVPLYEVFSTNVTSSIVSAFATAQTAQKSALAIADKDYELYLLYGEAAPMQLFASRATGSDEAVVRFRLHFREEGKDKPSYKDFEPALVKGLGAILDEVDTAPTEQGQYIRPARILTQNSITYTNLVRKVGDHGFASASVSDTAAGLKVISEMDIASIGISRGDSAVTGNGSAVLMIRNEDATSKFLATLATATTTDLTEESYEGELCTMQIFLKDKYRILLRVARIDSDPENAYVGFWEMVPDPNDNSQAQLNLSKPALVKGLGTMLSPILQSFKKMDEVK